MSEIFSNYLHFLKKICLKYFRIIYIFFKLLLQLQTLLNCCCRRKKFLASMTKLLGACQLLALRDHASAQDALCLMLEWSLLDGSPPPSVEDVNILGLQVVTTLQSTDSGRRRYMELCDRQLHLKELVTTPSPGTRPMKFSIFYYMK